MAANSFGVSLNSSTRTISVFTNDRTLKGTQTTLWLTANSTPQQSASPPIQNFIVQIIDTCPETVISLGSQTLTSMTMTALESAVTQTFQLATDNISVSAGMTSPNLCGNFAYTLTTNPSVSYITVSAG
jgi:hypothetical protein